MNLKRLFGWPLSRVLDDHDWRLARIESMLSLVTPTVLMSPETPVPPPDAERLDCGHVAIGKVTKHDGTTQCPACHEAEHQTAITDARIAHEAQDAQRRLQAENDAARDALRRGRRG